MFKKPNFFIIGAPKCGTTSLASWLSEHPNVFFTSPKEPEYFNSDIAPIFKGGIRKYESLYWGVNQTHLAVGEGSTVYLRSEEAVKNILSYQPNARFIVGIRNPLEMVVSWHGQMVRNGWESETDFKKAWDLQSIRAQGKKIPPLCPDRQHLQYGEVCKLGRQLKQFYKLVGKDRCYVYLLDDMKRAPGKLWKDILDFLQIPNTEKPNFPILNEGKDIPKLLSITGAAIDNIKQKVGLRWVGWGLITSIKSLFAKKTEIEISPEVSAELKDYFFEDISLLGEIIGRDVSSWLSNAQIEDEIR
jgi:Sulfotransferase domain